MEFKLPKLTDALRKVRQSAGGTVRNVLKRPAAELARPEHASLKRAASHFEPHPLTTVRAPGTLDEWAQLFVHQLGADLRHTAHYPRTEPRTGNWTASAGAAGEQMWPYLEQVEHKGQRADLMARVQRALEPVYDVVAGESIFGAEKPDHSITFTLKEKAGWEERAGALPTHFPLPSELAGLEAQALVAGRRARDEGLATIADKVVRRALADPGLLQARTTLGGTHKVSLTFGDTGRSNRVDDELSFPHMSWLHAPNFQSRVTERLNQLLASHGLEVTGLAVSGRDGWWGEEGKVLMSNLLLLDLDLRTKSPPGA